MNPSLILNLTPTPTMIPTINTPGTLNRKDILPKPTILDHLNTTLIRYL